MQLVLASTSSYKRELLSRLGVTFTVSAPRCDEEALKREGDEAGQLALHLAHAKAASVFDDHPHAYVLGSDQLVDLDGQLLGKPGSVEACCAQLSRLSGRVHRLLTAYALLAPSGVAHTHVDTTILHMRALQPSEIARYVAVDRPLDCAGSYKIEAGGIALFDRIDCRDFTAITGLPLIALSGLLRRLGFAVP